jgi:LasA protease
MGCTSRALFGTSKLKPFSLVRLITSSSILAALLLGSCRSSSAVSNQPSAISPLPSATSDPQSEIHNPSFTPRPLYNPGELVDYVAQTGDTLPEANSFIPASATTLPPSMPMEIPIYYTPFWGSQYLILPDSLYVNGPAQVGFDVEAFVAQTTGWLNGYSEYASGEKLGGAQIVALAAQNFSVSPRLLLALLEYQSGALTQSAPPDPTYPLGYVESEHQGVYLQLVWAANTLNNGYYGWRTGRLTIFQLLDERLERPDPWQTAATVALQYYFSRLLDPQAYTQAISPNGFAQVYQSAFGNPWQDVQPHILGNLTQPEMSLPFTGKIPWTYTGGPHTGWGEGDPLAAVDFAPTGISGCGLTNEWVTAVASGVVVRSESAIVVLDLDGDGDERTGWVVFYLHLTPDGRAPLGATLRTGDPVGHPSCEGGNATGTHVHLARKYNGEWITADGPLALNLAGWVAHNGIEPYQGTLTRYSKIITACECSNQDSQIQTDEK